MSPIDDTASNMVISTVQTDRFHAALVMEHRGEKPFKPSHYILKVLLFHALQRPGQRLGALGKNLSHKLSSALSQLDERNTSVDLTLRALDKTLLPQSVHKLHNGGMCGAKTLRHIAYGRVSVVVKVSETLYLRWSKPKSLCL